MVSESFGEFRSLGIKCGHEGHALGYAMSRSIRLDQISEKSGAASIEILLGTFSLREEIMVARSDVADARTRTPQSVPPVSSTPPLLSAPSSPLPSSSQQQKIEGPCEIREEEEEDLPGR